MPFMRLPSISRPLSLATRTIPAPPLARTPIFLRAASSRQPPSQTHPEEAPHPLSYRDHHIPYSTVRMVTPDGLSPPTYLRDLLSTYNPSTHTLALLSIDGPDPIVKLMSKSEERQKEIQREEKSKIQRKLGIDEKEVQVSWQSAKGDLEHKLGLAKGLLQKGMRVQVVFANRRRAEAIAPKSQEEIVALFDETLSVVGKKWREDEQNKTLWALYYNPLESTRQEVEKKVLDHEMEKRMEKEKLKEDKLEARRKKEERRQQRAHEMEQRRLEAARKAEEEYRRRQEAARGFRWR